MINCEQFKDALEEFVDGSLAASEQADARAHLENCAACRLALQRRQARAKLLQSSLQSRTQDLRLSSEARRNIVDTLKPSEPAPGMLESLRAILWRRGWTVALIVCLGLAIFGSQFYRSQEKIANVAASNEDTRVIDIPFQTETHISRIEGDKAVDAVVSSEGVLSAGYSEKNSPSSSTKPRSENRNAIKT